MKFETKFDVGDTVWCIFRERIESSKRVSEEPHPECKANHAVQVLNVFRHEWRVASFVARNWTIDPYGVGWSDDDCNWTRREHELFATEAEAQAEADRRNGEVSGE